MTKIKSDEEFMDFMQAVINDETIEAIEVNYYNTGNSYVALYNKNQEKICPDHEFAKLPNKSNRLSGEMGYLETHNPHIKINRSKLFARDTYEITKNSTPVASVEKTSFETPYTSKHEDANKKWENVLEVFEHELSQPQVNSVTLSAENKHAPILKVISGDSENLFRGKETIIHLDPKNYGEAIRFIVKNNGSLGEKYSVEFIPNMGKTLEETPIAAYRSDTYVNTPVSQKNPVRSETVLLDIVQFMERQIDNDDVKLFYIEKMEDTGAETVKVELISGACVAFPANDGDLEKVQSYSKKNNALIEASGFWYLSQTQHGGGSRKMVKIRALPVFRTNEKGSQVVMNMKRFFMRSLANPSHYLGWIDGPQDGKAGSIVIQSSTNISTTHEIETTPEVFEAFCNLVAEKAESLEKKYDVSINATSYSNQRVYFQKNYMVDYRNLIGTETLTEEMFKFLAEAYGSGCNILIKGNTGSGKTTFLRALYEAANDKKLTALIGQDNELLFPNSADNFIALRGSGDNLTQTALKINPARVVIDDVRLRHSRIAGFMQQCEVSKIQMVASLHVNIERLQECKDSFINPFEIEVELENGKVKAINQLIVSGHNVEKNVLWAFEGEEFRKLNIPSRSLRRKIEQNLSKMAKEVSPKVEDKEAIAPTALVTISPEEKEELLQAMETIKKYINLF